MSKDTHAKHNTNTSEITALLTDPLNLQIVEMVSREELSSQEISEIVHRNKKKVRNELSLLAKSHILKRNLHNHHVTYSLSQPQLTQTIHILYRLWANSVVHA